jgi:hypothetical protein
VKEMRDKIIVEQNSNQEEKKYGVLFRNQLNQRKKEQNAVMTFLVLKFTFVL